MKNVLFHLMFLLVGSAFTDQLEDQAGSSLGEIQAALRQMTASLTELKIEVQTVKRENTDQETKLESQEAEINRLKKQLEVTQVAFSAHLSDIHKNFGPFNTDTTLAFKHVVTNIGNAYNGQTGIFTAPVKGVYHFELHIIGEGANHENAAVLMKNGERTFSAFEHQTNGISSSSNGIALLLEEGDQVYVNLWANKWVLDNDNKHTTFSGHLLFTM